MKFTGSKRASKAAVSEYTERPRVGKMAFRRPDLAVGEATRALRDARFAAADALVRAVATYDGSQVVFGELFGLAFELGMSRAEVANWFGTAASTIGRWARGKNAPPKYARGALVRELGELVEARRADWTSEAVGEGLRNKPSRGRNRVAQTSEVRGARALTEQTDP